MHGHKIKISDHSRAGLLNCESNSVIDNECKCYAFDNFIFLQRSNCVFIAIKGQVINHYFNYQPFNGRLVYLSRFEVDLRGFLMISREIINIGYCPVLKY